MNLSKIIITLIMTICLSSLLHANDEIESIKSLINKTYDTPHSKVVIDPVIVVKDHAVASWTQSEKGGRVILHRNKHKQWEVVLCSGKAVTRADFLAQSGIPNSVADELSEKLRTAEAGLSVHQIEKFNSFNAVVYGAHRAKGSHSSYHDKRPSGSETSQQHEATQHQTTRQNSTPAETASETHYHQ